MEGFRGVSKCRGVLFSKFPLQSLSNVFGYSFLELFLFNFLARMNQAVPRPRGEVVFCRPRRNMFTSWIVGLALVVSLSPLTFAQQPAPAPSAVPITGVSFAVPEELEAVTYDLVLESLDLVGAPSTSPKISAFAAKVGAFLRENGYPFANAVATFDPAAPGKLTLAVKPGKLGLANVDGNVWLSSEGILRSLGWKEGETFHYGNFYSSASTFNKNRFVEVDSKLRPRRGEDGGIIVDADFSVEDSVPVVLTVDVINDGPRQSSRWRVGAGLEWWEPFSESDRLSFSWSGDASSPSQISSYSFNYIGKSGDKTDWFVYGGYSESEYDNVVSGADLDILGEGLNLGLAGTRRLTDSGSLALSFGATYLNVSNSMTFYGTSYSDERLSLFLPRLGLQGILLDALPGKTFWSAGVVTDAGFADDADLATQRPGVSSGFFVGQFGLTTLQPLDFFSEGTGLYLGLYGQVVDAPVPVSLQKGLGGSRSVRGYLEREAYGDNGVHLNTELRLPSRSASAFGLEGSVQPLFFYDYGYVSSESSISGTEDSVGMQSVGAGLIGSFEKGLDFSLHVGVPIESSPLTDSSSPHAHLDLSFRF